MDENLPKMTEIFGQLKVLQPHELGQEKVCYFADPKII